MTIQYKILSTLLLSAIIFVGLNFYGSLDNRQIETDKFTYDDGYALLAGQQITFDLADNAAEQAVGLSNRSFVNLNQGMLFAFTEPNIPTFWMKNMTFSIDILWINNGKIVDISRNVDPQIDAEDADLRIYSPNVPVNMVLELQAGWADRYNVTKGQDIEVVRVVR